MFGIVRCRAGARVVPALLAALLAPAGLEAQTAGGVDLVLAPEGNEARYLVREQLAGIEFPGDAVGRTSSITGRIVLDETGAVVKDSSKFTIELATLETDQGMRDRYVRRNTLETDEHPSAVFVPASFEGLTFPLPASGTATFRVTGDLTIREVTRPVTWEVTANFANGGVSGQAKTSFTFAEFQMEKPRVARVLSVDDQIRLEVDFRFVANGG